MKPMNLAGTGDDPGLDLPLNLGTGNAREIREGTGEELVAGRMTEKGTGI